MAKILCMVLACVSLVSADPIDLGATIRGLPSAVRNNLRQFRIGTRQMWVNGKEAGLIKTRLKVTSGATVTYSELQLLRKSSEDTSKLMRAGLVWLVAPELIPAMLYFYPRALPSTFESERGATRRHATLCRTRATATLQFLAKLDEDSAGSGRKAKRAVAQRLLAVQMVQAHRARSALVPVEPFFAASEPPPDRNALRKGKARAIESLKQLPAPLLKSSCRLIGLSGPVPGPIRRGALASHLDQLVEEDTVLRRTPLSDLSHEELVEACLDRALARPDASDAALRQALSAWLRLVDPAAYTKAHTSALPPDPYRLRLATMAASAIVSTRSAPEVTLSRLLFSP